jgi:hypothetical protein
MKINGSLVFDASSASEVQNLRVQKFALLGDLPTWTSADAGRLVYVTGSGIIYYGTATAWMPLATGGNAFSQTEGDAIETSLGTGVNSSGVFVPASFPTTFSLTNPTSFTDAINQLAAYATANNTLYEMDDVSLSQAVPTGAKFLFTAGGANWVDHTLVLADVSNVTATAAEVNELHLGTAVQADFIKLHNVTASAADLSLLTGAAGPAPSGVFTSGAVSSTMLSYLGGTTPVTSSIQLQLNNKQALDADLTAISALTSTGIAVRSAADTWTTVSLVAPAAGITIAAADGVLGNPTFALANDLAGIEGLTTTGFAVRTTADTWDTRSIVTGSSTRIVVTQGDGVAGSPSIDLAAVTQDVLTTSKSFVKILLDAYGRVIGNTPVLTSDITALADTTYVNITGDTMTGNLTFSSGTVTGLPTPVNASDATNKAYVDATSSGLSWKQAVKAATLVAGTLATSFAAGQIVDNYTLVLGDRILVKSQTAQAENGIYIVTAGAPTRSTDADTAQELDGLAVFVTNGTQNADTSWVQTANLPLTLETSAIVFSQFAGTLSAVAGIGLYQDGNQLSINMGAGIVALPSDEVGIDLYSASAGALVLTDNGTARSTTTSSKLHLLLPTGSGLAQDATGLYVPANGITNAMILNDTITINVDTAGTGTLNLGGTLSIFGNSTQGVGTSVTGTDVTVTVANATDTQRGVARFATNTFVVTTGNVDIKSAGVLNSMLANPSFGVQGTTGGIQQIALGTTLSVLGGTAPITTVSAAGSITIDVADATTGAKGLASFNSSHFTVLSGAVSLAATLGDLLNVAVGVDAPADKAVLQFDGSSGGTNKWTNVSTATLLSTGTLENLGDVGTAAPTTANQVLVANGSTWNALSIYFQHTQAADSSSWTVNHNLGQQFCNVTIAVDVGAGVYEVVIPQSITFTSVNQLVVTFNTAVKGKVVVMGIAAV